jgi:hypothetical protein
MSVQLLAFSLGAACAAPASQATVPQAADARPAAELASTVRSAALFKNGLAFVLREARVEGGARAATLGTLPVPAHGTFWIATDPVRLELVSAVARRSVLGERKPAVTLEQLLRANVGRELTLFLGDDQSLTGTLLAMPEPEPVVVDDSNRWRPLPTGTLLLLDTGSSTAALSPGSVQRVSATGELAREYEERSPGAALELALTPKADGPNTLSILYLVRGLTWAPSYAIDISAEGTAVLTAKAEVINDVEQLDGATLQFVTGFPNLQFAHVIDPLAMRGDMEAFFTALGLEPGSGVSSVARQAVMSNVAWSSSSESGRFPVAGAPAEGAAVEDLFFYERKDVMLARGTRGLYPLFSARVPYEHLYEWEIADTVEAQQRSDVQSPEEEVWHSVRLTNDAGLPWTTAPAMTMKDGNLLGQDTLHYTASGTKADVRITRAVDVQGEQTEFEIARERNAANFYGYAYDKVTVQGALRATNHKREAVRLEITKRIQGEVTKNREQAQIVATAKGLRRVNPNLTLTWSVPIEAGATREIGYEYTLFVRP